jgi:hypothetical protein
MAVYDVCMVVCVARGCVWLLCMGACGGVCGCVLCVAVCVWLCVARDRACVWLSVALYGWLRVAVWLRLVIVYQRQRQEERHFVSHLSHSPSSAP